MVRYVPVNLTVAGTPPMLAQAVPTKPEPPSGVPSTVVNLAIMVAGVGIGLLGFYHHKKPLGAIAMGMGGSVAGVGLIFTVLDIFGFRPTRL